MRIEKCGRILDYLYYIRNYFTTLRWYSVSGAAVRLKIEKKCWGVFLEILTKVCTYINQIIHPVDTRDNSQLNSKVFCTS